jgi:hypothetical protein
MANFDPAVGEKRDLKRIALLCGGRVPVLRRNVLKNGRPDDDNPVGSPVNPNCRRPIEARPEKKGCDEGWSSIQPMAQRRLIGEV